LTSALSKNDILRLLGALNEELRTVGVKARVHLAGGAVMCLAFDARASTLDVDALFQPSVKVLDAALRVASKEKVPETWLNDAVKSYVSDRGTFDPFLEMSNLKVFCASAEYMLAMKCLAMRIGEGYHDEEDVRYLLRNLDVRRYEDAEEILRKYYPLDEFPRTAFDALRELLPSG
jgi:hypothetical protein